MPTKRGECYFRQLRIFYEWPHWGTSSVSMWLGLEAIRNRKIHGKKKKKSGPSNTERAKAQLNYILCASHERRFEPAKGGPHLRSDFAPFRLSLLVLYMLHMWLVSPSPESDSSEIWNWPLIDPTVGPKLIMIKNYYYYYYWWTGDWRPWRWNHGKGAGTMQNGYLWYICVK